MNPQAARRTAQRGGILFKLLILLAGLAVLGLLYLLRGPLLRAAGNFWVVNETPLPADAIIVLGDDNFLGERAARAAELYHQRWAPRVVASGRYLRPYASAADLIQRDLITRGVPADAVVHFAHRASNTREEAIEVHRLLGERGWRRIVVVTSNSHTRRARYIFRGILGGGIEMRMVASSDADFDPNSWWQSRSGWKTVLYETVGFLVAIWELWGQDAPPAPPRKSGSQNSGHPVHGNVPLVSQALAGRTSPDSIGASRVLLPAGN